MKTFKEIITESSLSRIYAHIQSDRPIAFITAFRGTYTLADNRKRNKQLESDIRKAGLGFVRVRGYYVENYGTKDANPVNEERYLVIGNENDSGNLKGVKLITKNNQKVNNINKH